METLTNIGFFALLFFLLVFIHELGHFLMAKWVGIRVEKFSIGMGPKIFSFTKGETEYRLAWIPLGGYVKMSGDDPSKEYSEEEKKRGFLTQKPPAKLLVVFGGPVFNLILPVFIYAGMLAIGIPHVDSVIGTVSNDSAASEIGLQSGDRILSVNGRAAKDWKFVEETIKDLPNQSVDLKIERLNLRTGALEVLEKQVTPRLEDGRSRFGEEIKVGRIGVSPTYPLPRIFFEDQNSALAQAGLKPYDQIVSVNGMKILSMEQWRRFLDGYSELELVVDFKRGEASENIQTAKILIPPGDASVQDRLGLLPIELVVGALTEDGQAKQAGMQIGDRLVSISGKTLTSWEDVPEIIKNSEGSELEYLVSRQGESLKFLIAAEKTTVENPILGKDDPLSTTEKYRIGVSPDILADSSFVIERSLNPVALVHRGLAETWDKTSMTVEALFKLVTGQLSIRLLGSPIMIYKVAGNSYRMAGGGHHGWISFFTILAMLSITLGLVNLMPIPVLDGGHAVFFTVEWIRGRPISLKAMEIATQAGFVVLIGLFIFVFYNDIDRYKLVDKFLNLFQ